MKVIETYAPEVGDLILIPATEIDAAIAMVGKITKLCRHCSRCEPWIDVSLYKKVVWCPNIADLKWDKKDHRWEHHPT